MTRSPALLLLLMAGSAEAVEREDFGYQWPLRLDANALAHRVVLPTEVYVRIHDPALRDLAVFNADGETVPFGPIPKLAGTLEGGQRERIEVPWFVLPKAVGSTDADALRLLIERDGEGKLRRLDATIAANSADSPAAPDAPILLDLRAVDAQVESLELDWQRGDLDLRARFRLTASDDLEHWNEVLAEASVVDLEQGGFSLQRRRIDLARASSRDFLQLIRLDEGAALPLTGIGANVRRRSEFHETELAWISLRPIAQDEAAATYHFSVPGPLPVSRIAIDWNLDNAVATVAVSSRFAPAAAWQTRAGFTAFKVGNDKDVVSNDDVPVALSRDRHWQVQVRPDAGAEPTLRLGYRPDEFALLAQGRPPFVLVAGSRHGGGADYPMDVLVTQLSQQTGDKWVLELAAIGQEQTLSGAAAVAPEVQVPWRKWVLWAVLLGGVVLIGGMVLKLLREGGRTS